MFWGFENFGVKNTLVNPSILSFLDVILAEFPSKNYQNWEILAIISILPYTEGFLGEKSKIELKKPSV